MPHRPIDPHRIITSKGGILRLEGYKVVLSFDAYVSPDMKRRLRALAKRYDGPLRLQLGDRTGQPWSVQKLRALGLVRVVKGQYVMGTR